MATGLSVLTATIVWTRRQYREWRERQRERPLRGWRDYINPHGINEWDVRLVVDPAETTALVVLEVLSGPDGASHEQLAQNMRQIILRDGMLSRSPTPDQRDFLIQLWPERRASAGAEIQYRRRGFCQAPGGW
jgi:hypothetical protein